MPLFTLSRTGPGSSLKGEEWSYEKVRLTENTAASEEDCSQDFSIDSRPRARSSKQNLSFLLINTALFLSSLAFLAITINLRRLNDHDALRQVSGFSPIFDKTNLRLKDVKVNGTLYPPKNPSFSRQEPGDPEAEDIWASLEVFDVFPITRDEVIGLGKDPETAVKLPDEHFGLGDDVFAASLDISHKLHCLNTLRKIAFEDYIPFAGGEVHYKDEIDAHYHGHRKHNKLWWYHLRHCVDVLTQELLCHATPDLITYNFRDTQVHAFFDFSINRKCTDFSQLEEYRDRYSVNQDAFNQLRYQPNGTTKLIPYEREFYHWRGFTGSTLFPDGQGFEEYFAENEW